MWSLEPSTVRELLCYNCSPVCGSPIQHLYGRANGDLLQENLCHTLCLPGLLLPVPCPCGRPLLTHTSTGEPQTLTGRLVTIGSLYLQVCFILLLIFYFRDSTCKWKHTVFVFVSDISLSIMPFRSIHVCCNKISFLFMTKQYSIVYHTCTCVLCA